MKSWFAAVLLGIPTLSGATVVEYSFEGTVTSASGIYSSAPIGATVIGKYSFDLAAATVVSGTPGSYSSTWLIDSFGGSFYFGSPEPPASVVFSTTAQVLGTTISYGSGPISNYMNYARLQGDYYQLEGGASFFAWEGTAVDSMSATRSGLYLLDPATIMYGPDGLPLPIVSPSSPTASLYGYFQTEIDYSQSFLYFDIQSMTPVPLPATAPLLVGGVLALAWVSRRQRARLLATY